MSAEIIADVMRRAPTDAEVAFGIAGLAPGAVAPTPAVAVQAAAALSDEPPRAVRWLTDKKRVESYELAFPFEMDGIEYRNIAIRRLTAREVEAFMARMRAAPSATSLHWPIYFVGDVELPHDAWEAMDDDDRFALEEATDDFLGARFRSAAA